MFLIQRIIKNRSMIAEEDIAVIGGMKLSSSRLGSISPSQLEGDPAPYVMTTAVIGQTHALNTSSPEPQCRAKLWIFYTVEESVSPASAPNQLSILKSAPTEDFPHLRMERECLKRRPVKNAVTQ